MAELLFISEKAILISLIHGFVLCGLALYFLSSLKRAGRSSLGYSSG
jgi:hypothetical protein